MKIPIGWYVRTVWSVFTGISFYIFLCVAAHIQSNLNSSNTDGSFTMANSI